MPLAANEPMHVVHLVEQGGQVNKNDKKDMLQVAEGAGWDELCLNARVTIRRHLQDEEEMSTTARREHARVLVKRGLPKEGIPLGLRNFEY